MGRYQSVRWLELPHKRFYSSSVFMSAETPLSQGGTLTDLRGLDHITEKKLLKPPFTSPLSLLVGKYNYLNM